MFERIREDIRCILERDPAARNAFEVLTCYAGLHAVLFHRLAHWCWRRRMKWLGRFISQMARWLTGIEIHPAAIIGRRVFFDHAMGVVVGETAEIGDGCTIYQGVTLGGTSLYKGVKRHPTLEKNVVVGAGAKVLGGFTVGAGARIGSNAVVVRPVPAGVTVAGIPAHVIQEKAPPPTEQTTAGEETSPATQEDAFQPYGVTGVNGDPLHHALHEVISATATQEQQIVLLWNVVEELSRQIQNCQATLPEEATRVCQFEAERINELIDK